MGNRTVGVEDRHASGDRRPGPDRGDRPAPSARPADDRLRVVVGDGDALSRCGLASLLEARGVTVVGQAADLETLLELVRSRRPALVLIDALLSARMGDDRDSALEVRAQHPEVGLVLLATHVQIEPAATLLAAGAGVGYLARSRVDDVEDFIATLRRVARGGTVTDPALIHAMLEAQRHHDPLEVLTPRERDVLGQMAEGRSNYGIARALWVAPATVEKHVRSILTKLCLPEGPTDHRRVLAVLAYLDSDRPAHEPGAARTLSASPGGGRRS